MPSIEYLQALDKVIRTGWRTKSYSKDIQNPEYEQLMECGRNQISVLILPINEAQNQK
jgi:hypothetical protein